MKNKVGKNWYERNGMVIKGYFPGIFVSGNFLR